MVLNFFLKNISASTELEIIGAFILSIYWFVLRRYNSLGLRLFVLCFMLFIVCFKWVYNDEIILKNVIAAGEEHVATVISKSKTGNNDNAVAITFTAKDGSTVNTSTSDYVSQQEWDNFETGKPLSVIYVAATQQTYVQQSIMRFKEDKIALSYFTSFWLLLGTVLYIWLRKYKVGVNENTGDEWVEKEDGSIIPDERKSGTVRVVKRMKVISKMLQAFNK